MIPRDSDWAPRLGLSHRQSVLQMEARVTFQNAYSPTSTSPRAAQCPRRRFSTWGMQSSGLRFTSLSPPSALPLHDLFTHVLSFHYTSSLHLPSWHLPNPKESFKYRPLLQPLHHLSFCFPTVLCTHFITALGSFFWMISFLSPSLHYELFEGRTIFSMSLPNESMNERMNL